MCPNMERDVRKGHRAKYPKIRGNASIVNRKMVEKCMVFACSNSRNVEKGISIHKIPSDNDPRPEWCPFLTSQLRKCQISDASHWLVLNEPARQKFVQRGLKRAKI